MDYSSLSDAKLDDWLVTSAKVTRKLLPENDTNPGKAGAGAAETQRQQIRTRSVLISIIMNQSKLC